MGVATSDPTPPQKKKRSQPFRLQPFGLQPFRLLQPFRPNSQLTADQQLHFKHLLHCSCADSDWLLGSTEDMPPGAKTQPRLHIEGDMVRGQPQQNKSESRKSAGGPFQGDKFHLQGQVKGGMCSSPSIAPKKPAKSTTSWVTHLDQSNEPAQGIEPWTFSLQD